MRIYRNNFISILRIFCIYWVVLVQHNIAYYGGLNPYSEQLASLPYSYLITELTMPLCFAISGYVLHASNSIKKHSIYDFIKRKFYRLLFPCWIFGLLFQFLIERTISPGFVFGTYHLWFLAYLFVIQILTYFLVRYTNRWIYVCLVLIFTAYVLGIINQGVNYYLDAMLTVFAKYWFFFLVGYVISKIMAERTIRRNLHFAFCIVAFVSIIGFVQFNSWIVHLLYMVVMVVSLLSIASYPKISQIRIGMVVSYLDNTSYSVYILHWIYVWLLIAIIIKCLDIEILNTHTIFCSYLIGIMSILLSIITNIYYKRVASLCFGNKNNG